ADKSRESSNSPWLICKSNGVLSEGRPKLLTFFRPVFYTLLFSYSIFSAFFAHFLLTTTVSLHFLPPPIAGVILPDE
ncbi:MAG: hypothetical protein RBT41_11040, partial [Clostridia bacterium]|nr:hypothetical protein [Clostridia bacterium]